MGILPMNSAFRLPDNMAIASRARCPCHNITHYSLRCGRVAARISVQLQCSYNCVTTRGVPGTPAKHGFSFLPISSVVKNNDQKTIVNLALLSAAQRFIKAGQAVSLLIIH
jgi:hypothetical protein